MRVQDGWWLARRHGLPLLLLAAGWVSLRGQLHIPGAPAVVPGIEPSAVAAGPSGILYVADWYQHCVWAVDGLGRVSRVAGTGRAGFGGDGGPAMHATFSSPSGLAVDWRGDLLIADSGNRRIRRVDQRGVVVTAAGGAGEFGGELRGVACDHRGNVYVADHDHSRLCRIGRGGEVVAVRRMDRPMDLAADGRGNVYVASYRAGAVWRVRAGGGLATVASLEEPRGIAVSPEGVVYVGTKWGRVYQLVEGQGLVAVAGKGGWGRSPDAIPALRAELDFPTGLAADAHGGFYIAEWGAGRVRKVDRAGMIHTVIAARRLRH